MQIYTCNTGNVNRRFSVTPDQRIAWANHGECLDLTEGDLADGNQVSDSSQAYDKSCSKPSTCPDVEMYRWKRGLSLDHQSKQQPTLVKAPLGL